MFEPEDCPDVEPVKLPVPVVGEVVPPVVGVVVVLPVGGVVVLPPVEPPPVGGVVVPKPTAVSADDLVKCISAVPYQVTAEASL